MPSILVEHGVLDYFYWQSKWYILKFISVGNSVSGQEYVYLWWRLEEKLVLIKAISTIQTSIYRIIRSLTLNINLGGIKAILYVETFFKVKSCTW